MQNIKLTKSRFKLGWDCPTKLYFNDHRTEYCDLMSDDPFMAGLAEGGYQVGEFARWMLCAHPEADTIETMNKDAALAETRRRMADADVTIAEAAFQDGHLFIRADVIVKAGNVLKLYEVKSKSWDGEAEFWTKREPVRLSAKWEEYLLDVAFQKHVIEKSCPGLTVQAHLVLLDKGKCASVDGLSRMFPVVRRNDRPCVERRFAKKEDLGEDVLAYINVDDDIAKIQALDFDLPRGGTGRFIELIEQLSAIQQSGQPFFCGIGSKCKACSFRLPPDPREAAALVAKGYKSGRDECWSKAVGRGYDPTQPKVIELWNFRKTSDMIAAGKFHLRDLDAADIGAGTCAARQVMQLEKVKHGDDTPWIDRDGLSVKINNWRYPLHFIDFETARMALPGHRGMPPYMQVAFQFSHHTVDKAGQVHHAGQWIEARPGVFPSFDFVRALKKQLEADGGTIFRYAAHENSVLRDIHGQLEGSAETDRAALMQWIDSVTEYKAPGAKQKDPKTAGPRNMVDMRTLVIDHHYDPATHGSNSLKYVLPAIIGSSTHLRRRYGQSLSQSGIHSLNCPADWIWVRPERGNDPYAALPAVFEGREQEALSEYVRGLDELDDGGTATIAYAKLQYCDLPDAEREAIRSALLRYCELDTLAMVMLFEYWKEVVLQ